MIYYGKLKAHILFNFDNKINFLRKHIVKGRPADEIQRQQLVPYYPFPASDTDVICKKTKQNSIQDSTGKIQLKNCMGKRGVGEMLRLRFCSHPDLYNSYLTCQIVPEYTSTSNSSCDNSGDKEVAVSPWLVWFSGLRASLHTERLQVQLLVWVVAQVPSWGHLRVNQLMFVLLPPFFSL